MKIGGEDLGQNVRDIVTGSNEFELNNFVMNLLTKPVHLDAEMTVSSRDNVVANHSYTGLIVFEKARSAVLVETHSTSFVASVAATYSTSAVLRHTAVVALVSQATKQPDR